jgi:hypothetical protein
MKRYWLLLAVFALVLAACGGGDEGTDTTEHAGTDTTVDAGTDTTAAGETDTTTDAGTETTTTTDNGLPEGSFEGLFHETLLGGPDLEPFFVPEDGTYEGMVIQEYVDDFDGNDDQTVVLAVVVDGTEEEVALLFPGGLIEPTLEFLGSAVTLTVADGVPSIEFTG